MEFQHQLISETRQELNEMQDRELHPIQNGKEVGHTVDTYTSKRKVATHASRGNQTSLNRKVPVIKADQIQLLKPASPLTSYEIRDILHQLDHCCKKSHGCGSCLERAFGDDLLGEEVDHTALYRAIRNARELTRLKEPDEVDEFLFSKVKESIDGPLTGKIFKFKYKCPDAIYPDRNLCRNSFAALYGFSVWSIEKCSKALKTNINLTSFPLRDIRESVVHPYTVDATEQIFIDNCCDVDSDLVTAAVCPSGEGSTQASLWLEDQFLSFADNSPNRGTRSYAVTYKKELYTSYKKEMQAMNIKVIDVADFYRLWKTCFPKYLLRPWINVPGKCDVCYEIDSRLKNATSRQAKEALRQCHHMHRGGLFQIERRKYKSRVYKALKHPDKVFSCIIDGMDQSHSRIPYLAAMQQFSNPLCQHIQGALTLGNGVTLYRTFNNVPKGANLTIYTFLSELEAWRDRKGCYPEEIYLQVDGGSENANKYVLGVLEMLIIKRVSRVVYYTRLPTGHTHEDIDAVFAHIWKGMRMRPVHTVNEYREHVGNVFTKKLQCEITDVYVIPDYKTIMEPYIDKDLKDYTKEDDTQHQWRFEAVDETPGLFPLGCRTMYRAYSADKVVEFEFLQPSQCVTPVGQLCGLEPRTTYVKWYPDADTFPGRRCDGYYLLTDHPTIDENSCMKPQKFKCDSNGVEGQTLEEMRSTARSCISRWSQDTRICREWIDWMNEHVPSDVSTAAEYVEKLPHLYHEPLKYLFFRDTKLEPYWNELGKFKSTREENDDIDWPTEIIAACRQSVCSSFDKNPPLPRVYATLNEDREVLISGFFEKAKDYYDQYLSGLTVPNIAYLHRRRIDKNGGRPDGSTNRQKKTLITYVKQSDKEFVSMLHRRLVSERLYSVNRLINKLFKSEEDYNKVVSTISGTAYKLKYGQLSQFQPNRTFDHKIISYFMALFQCRDDKLCEIFENCNKHHQNYVPHKSSKFLPPVNMNNMNCWMKVNLMGVERVYIPYLRSDRWHLLVVDFHEKKVYYIDGIHVNDTTLTTDNQEMHQTLIGDCNLVKSWLQLCNYEGITAFPDKCSLYESSKHFYEPMDTVQYNNSGLIIIVILDFIIHDCPVYFKIEYLNDFRIN